MNRSIRYPWVVLENVFVKVDKFIIPVDFVVLNIEKDVNIPIILGRPFLATTGTIIDVKNGRFKFQIGEEKVEFTLHDIARDPSFSDHVLSIDFVDELTQENSLVKLDYDSLEQCLIDTRWQKDEAEEKTKWA